MSDFINDFKSLKQKAEDKYSTKTGLGLSTSVVPNPGVSILFFLIITTILLIIKIFILPSDNLDNFKNESSVMKIIFILYILLLLAGNYLINTSITTELCSGTPQWGTTFIVTFIPWIIIFGILNIILIIFPGWLVPFSNTFGYFIVSLFGIKDLFNDKIIIPKSYYGTVKYDGNTDDDDDDHDHHNINVARALQQIYGNESLLINEIPIVGNSEDERVENFKNFYKTMQNLKIFRSDQVTEELENSKVQLYRLLKIKDYIAEYVWYILAGLLVSSITYNYIVNVGCSFSSAQMSNAYKDYIQEDLSKNSINNVSSNLEESQDIFMKSK